ncbi:hypothetical protein FN846DRAFT_920132 [Sphaerosporella brunnea]|uniref:Uncharacterized protein n=1 Tax=Sphaerosporella brunnea TaxID=1250544 RepID=A0A5J5ETM4_9PEZI|nr:hypothetical protein FN846DRAFT_920132 [Sphaerosporella brunnea]
MEILLSLHRLLCFKRDAFIPVIDKVTLRHLLNHSHRAVRSMVVRILCVHLKAPDAAQGEMLDKYGIGRHSETVLGPRQGCEVDYGFLISLESTRFQEMVDALEKARVDLFAIPDTTVSRIIRWWPRPVLVMSATRVLALLSSMSCRLADPPGYHACRSKPRVGARDHPERQVAFPRTGRASLACRPSSS